MPLPELIGRYRPVRRLGSGGFAVVWLAHDESLDAEVAVKVMADNWSDRMDLRERFLREAQMLRQASSYRVVQVFDIGELDDGRPYLVMEYADRGTLADRVKEHGAYPLAEALQITAEVARGVAELHAAGVVHRDLKPSNVLITSVRVGERLLVADLGVAKSLAHGSGVTMSVGSAGYMAPEQMEPQIGVDVRADVYSLGAFAFYLMTAQRPYLPLVMAEKMPAGLPRPVLETLLSALERDRENRWPDAASLAVRLDELASHVADDMTVAAPAPGLAGRPPTVVPSAPVSPTPGWSFAGTPAEPIRADHPGQRDQGWSGGPRSPEESAGYPGPATQGYDRPPGYDQNYPQQDYRQNFQDGFPQRPPGEPPRPSTGRPANRSGRRGRRRLWITTLTVIAVLAAATGVGTVLVWQSRAAENVTAKNVNGHVTLKVPRVFGQELATSGWDPASIGLAGGKADGLLLADHVRQWLELDSPVTGIFVGVSDSDQLSAQVGAIHHGGCTEEQPQPIQQKGWTGTSWLWTKCHGDNTVQEVALQRTPGGAGGPYVYLQIRQVGNSIYLAKDLVDGLTVSR